MKKIIRVINIVLFIAIIFMSALLVFRVITLKKSLLILTRISLLLIHMLFRINYMMHTEKRNGQPFLTWLML